jgi:hypothetical protein
MHDRSAPRVVLRMPHVTPTGRQRAKVRLLLLVASNAPMRHAKCLLTLLFVNLCQNVAMEGGVP